MIETLGNFSLAAAVLTSAAAVLLSIASVRQRSDASLRAARWGVGLTALFFGIASAGLVTAFLTNRFSIEYVADYSERALPLGYKVAAFWAGQSGSLLLWALMLGVMCAVAAYQFRHWRGRDAAGAIALLAVVGGFFAALMLFAANPFTLVEGPAPADGHGLNPMLQNPGMVLHPPLLFMGYAGFAIPFAVAIGVLIGGRTDNRWLRSIRRWLLVAWLFLTAGIVLGAWWAYVELGWGGYWAWDPVENASLLPWLTSTALLHSIMVQQQRGMFKRWNVSLIALSFILCIFGTYLTRSGVIDSVHAFPESPIGRFLLVFLIVSTAGSAALIAWRYQRLAPEHEMEGLISREGAFLLGNVMLLIMMLTTLVGTTFPILSKAVGADPISVGPPFYNRIVAPMALVVVALMAIGPVLAFGKSAALRIARSLLIPAIAAVLVTAVVGILGVHKFWALLCVAITTLGTFAVIDNFIRSVAARVRSTGEALAPAALHLIDQNHRRYGGQLAHLGLMMVVIGVIGSSLYNAEKKYELSAGESADLGRFTLTLLSVDEIRGANYRALQATIALEDEHGTEISVLTPQKRQYDKWQQELNTEVALRSTVRDDVYVILAGWEAGGEVVAIQALLNPLVLWIWLGGIVMAAGSFFCILPRMLPKARAVEVVEGAADRSTHEQELAPALAAPMGSEVAS